MTPHASLSNNLCLLASGVGVQSAVIVKGIQLSPTVVYG
jgi:hypothetical protein